ncbi:MAG: CpsD/CapB family tyrosine-protein kinase [Sphingomonadales bacterium]|nr:CpsD/CapB family tyrosine-protein kinase [Sphingomonadales bacterium]
MNSLPNLPRSVHELAPGGPLPGVGEVAEEPGLELSPKLVGFDSKDARSRSFNLLRAQLIKKLAETGGQLVGVTSPAPHAGKSFVASNLAASLGQLPNKRTFLIDLDLRRATIAQIFGLDASEGITEYLVDDSVELQKIGRHFRESNLVVYPTLPAPVNSAELMVSERLDQLIARARALGDDAIVIVDLPPVFANDDAILAAEKLDGVLVVVEQGVTTKKQLQGAMQLLHPTPILGTVFNRFKGGSGDPYGYGGKYSGYYSE